MTWTPSCSLELLKERARVVQAIRKFFEERGVLEVETPILSRAAATDPNLSSFQTDFHVAGSLDRSERLYLHTSPEFPMKRLLAAGAGSIYQMCKVFRDEESGRFHNPEFTFLEWYRVGFSLRQLIEETDALVLSVCRGHCRLAASETMSYSDAFKRHTGIDPLSSDISDMDTCAKRNGLNEAHELCGNDKSIWLDLLFSHLVQPHLGCGRLTYVVDYPAILPSLARYVEKDSRMVERVEVFWEGLELANGFHELADPIEQSRRFQADLEKRRSLGLVEPAMDRSLISALEAGLPDCSGIALGVDRMLIRLTGAGSIDEVLAFPVGRA